MSSIPLLLSYYEQGSNSRKPLGEQPTMVTTPKCHAVIPVLASYFGL